MFQAIIIRGQSLRYRSYIAWPTATFQKYNECKQKPLYLHSPTKATTRSVGFAHEFQKYKKVVWNTNLVFQTTSPRPHSLRQISTQTLTSQPIISSNSRHSRTGGNPSEILRNRYSKTVAEIQKYSGLTLNQYGVASPCRTICTVCGFVALSWFKFNPL